MPSGPRRVEFQVPLDVPGNPIQWLKLSDGARGIWNELGLERMRGPLKMGFTWRVSREPHETLAALWGALKRNTLWIGKVEVMDESRLYVSKMSPRLILTLEEDR